MSNSSCLRVSASESLNPNIVNRPEAPVAISTEDLSSKIVVFRFSGHDSENPFVCFGIQFDLFEDKQYYVGSASVTSKGVESKFGYGLHVTTPRQAEQGSGPEQNVVRAEGLEPSWAV